jgi:hypothetical protein
MGKDFLVQCNNPKAFDETIMQLGAASLVMGHGQGGYMQQDGYFVMRVFNNEGYIKFAVEHQGYGKVIKEIPLT